MCSSAYLLSSYFMLDTTISEMSMVSVFQINNSTTEKQKEFVSVKLALRLSQTPVGNFESQGAGSLTHNMKHYLTPYSTET